MVEFPGAGMCGRSIGEIEWWRFALVIVALASLPGNAQPSFSHPGALELRLDWRADGSAVVLSSLDSADTFCRLNSETQSRIFRVVPVWERQTESEGFTMLGSYSCHGATIEFTPQFPLVPGQKYKASFEWSHPHTHQPLKTSSQFTAPDQRAPAQPSEILAVYPSQEEVPENLLKIYLKFSHPMSLEQSRNYVHLHNESGEVIQGAFLDLREELWDNTRTRLTLLLDPGRIKRGLAPHLSEGLPIRTGKTFTLVVDQPWVDGKGHPLSGTWRQTFKVGPADREKPNYESWTWNYPKVESLEPVELSFGEAMDAALAVAEIQVVDAYQRVVPGEKMLTESESRWQFIPQTPWKGQTYTVLVNSRLEDLAGNNLLHAFDSDSNQDRGHHSIHRTLPFPFEPKP